MGSGQAGVGESLTAPGFVGETATRTMNTTAMRIKAPIPEANKSMAAIPIGSPSLAGRFTNPRRRASNPTMPVADCATG